MNHKSRNRRTEKRERFVQVQKRKGRIHPNYFIGAFGALVALALIYVAVADSNKSGAGTVAQTVQAEGPSSSQIAIPLSEVSAGQVKFYEYKTSSHKKVRFFVMKSSDGVYRAAADACVICYREKAGYHQEGDDMVCNKCRKHFPSAYVNEVTGGCNPDGVPRTIQGDKLVIAASDLEARTELF
jgi:uncharacterized membrane protein